MSVRLTPETAAQVARASSFDNEVAAERGRLMAARAIIENPEQRRKVEADPPEGLGIVYCRLHWPEAYEIQACHDVIEFIPRFHPTEPVDKPEYNDSGLLIKTS